MRELPEEIELMRKWGLKVTLSAGPNGWLIEWVTINGDRIEHGGEDIGEAIHHMIFTAKMNGVGPVGFHDGLKALYEARPEVLAALGETEQ